MERRAPRAAAMVSMTAMGEAYHRPGADGTPARVWFLIPAYDEAGAIGDVVRRALATGCADAVLVVDDGSTDETAAEAEAAGAVVVRLATNAGKGVALRAGVEAAGEADVLILMDADGQDDPADAPRLLDALAAGADLVIGSRFAGTLRDGAITPLNRFGNLALTRLMAWLYGHPIGDSQAGFRAARREALLRLRWRAQRYDVETEVYARALRAGLSVTEVPVTRSARAAGESKLPPLRTGLRVLATMLRCRWA